MTGDGPKMVHFGPKMAKQSGPNWYKRVQMVNQAAFDHLRPFWAHLDPFGPFQIKMIFCLKLFRQSLLCPVGAKKIIFDDSLVGQPTKTFPKYGLSRVFIARNRHFFNFVDFRVYFGHFSLVKSPKNKIAFSDLKECSNQKIEENKSGLEFNFL